MPDPKKRKGIASTVAKEPEAVDTASQDYQQALANVRRRRDILDAARGTEMEPYVRDPYEMQSALERPGEMSHPLMFTAPRPGQRIPYIEHEIYPGQMAHTGYSIDYPFDTPFVAPLPVKRPQPSGIMQIIKRGGR